MCAKKIFYIENQQKHNHNIKNDIIKHEPMYQNICNYIIYLSKYKRIKTKMEKILFFYFLKV